MIIENWHRWKTLLGLSVLNPQFFILREERSAISLASRLSKGIIVDLGAGEQLYKNELLKNAKEYIPVDLKKPLNKHIKQYVRADITKTLPFKNRFCDTVCLFQVLEYLDSPIPVFKESHRILKPSGILILSAPFLYPLHDAPHDKVRYTKQALLAFLKEAGFKKVVVQKESSGFAFLANAFNMFLLRAVYHRIKKGSASRIFALCAIPFVWSMCIMVNAVALCGELLFSNSSEEFPLNYTIVARK